MDEATARQAFMAADRNGDGHGRRGGVCATPSSRSQHSTRTTTACDAGRALGAGSGDFADADLNHDGRLTLDEVRTKRLEDFVAMDRNHDGVLTVDEVRGVPGRKVRVR